MPYPEIKHFIKVVFVFVGSRLPLAAPHPRQTAIGEGARRDNARHHLDREDDSDHKVWASNIKRGRGGVGVRGNAKKQRHCRLRSHSLKGTLYQFLAAAANPPARPSARPPTTKQQRRIVVPVYLIKVAVRDSGSRTGELSASVIKLMTMHSPGSAVVKMKKHETTGCDKWHTLRLDSSRHQLTQINPPKTRRKSIPMNLSVQFQCTKRKRQPRT